ncbi:MAG: hypothetical protein A2075_23335 [Geobacteraceae bacterium GWC2_58_44]|nr:MAG: hypothetical protein A2075_23335 [Geobacteraceae bacterium GWC2_58_44]
MGIMVNEAAFQKKADSAWKVGEALDGINRRLRSFGDKLSDEISEELYEELQETISTICCLSELVDQLGNEFSEYREWAKESGTNMSWPPEKVNFATFRLREKMLTELRLEPTSSNLKVA